MNEPIRIKRMAIQIETADGQLLHIYTEDPVSLVLEHHVTFQPYASFGNVAYDDGTTLTIEHLRNYRMTKGHTTPAPNDEIEGKKQIEN